ncbi:Silver-binding protein [Enterobacter sp. BNK-18]|uniref:Silver-binding protein n=1 Tax=Enterobacter sp. BNK-18 TaxID=3376155 RepID=UPI0039BF9708
MKKILLSIVTIMAVTSSGWAAETINMHDQVNNAQATAHQTMAEMHKKMPKAGPCNTTPESAKSFSAMNEHEKAAVVHETVNNGQSFVIHQQQAEKHRRMNQAN